MLEKVRQAAPDLYIIASDYSESADAVIAAVRGRRERLSGAADAARVDFRDAMTRLERLRDGPGRGRAGWARSIRFWAQRAASAPLRLRSTSRRCWRSGNRRPCCSIWMERQ